MTLQFETINMERQAEYLKRLAQCSQISSDYSFVNLWGWAEEYGLEWAWKGQLVWIKQTKPKVLFWPPVGSWEDVNWVENFNELFNEPTEFTRTPEKLARSWETLFGSRLTIEEERNNWDYLYDVKELVELKGNRFHKKKNLLNQFHRKYDYTYVPMSRQTTEKAIGMQTSWCTWRDCESVDTLAAENRTIEKVLKKWQNLTGLMGGAILVEGTMVAYTVAEHLPDDTLLIHFEKGSPGYKGIYQAINQMFLANLTAECKFVNREQDLGDEGLRKAKLSYNPVDFLRKYRVTIT
jgi:hypothetical protein